MTQLPVKLILAQDVAGLQAARARRWNLNKRQFLQWLLAAVGKYWAQGFAVWDVKAQALGSPAPEHGRYRKPGRVKASCKIPPPSSAKSLREPARRAPAALRQPLGVPLPSVRGDKP